MGDIARKFTWAFVPSFLASILVVYLSGDSLLGVNSEHLQEIGAGILTISFIQVGFLTIIFAIPSYLIASYILSLIQRGIKRRNEIQRKNSPAAFAVGGGPPSTVYWEGNIIKWGVLWVCVFGRDRRNEYAHVTGPYCTNCGTELLTRTEPKWLFLEKKVWRCPDCQKVVSRPKDVLFEEKRAIERICEKVVHRAADEGQDYFEEQDHIITIQWNPQ